MYKLSRVYAFVTASETLVEVPRQSSPCSPSEDITARKSLGVYSITVSHVVAFVLVLLSYLGIFILNRYEAQNGTADEVKER